MRQLDGFGDVLGRELEKSGVSLTSLHDSLCARGETVSVATLSYWRSGGRVPDVRSEPIVAAIEEILVLEPHSLRRLIPRSRRIGTIAHPGADLGALTVRPGAREVLRLLAASRSSDASDRRVLSHHLVADVGAGSRVTLTHRVVIQALSDGVREHRSILLAPGGAEVRIRDAEPHGIRLAREVRHPAGEAYGQVWELDRSLRRGEIALVEYAIDGVVGSPIIVSTLGAPTREAMLQVRFDREVTPDWLEEIDGDPFHPGARPLRNENPDMAIAFRRDIGPAAFGIRWDHDG
ncbi:MULTISPECIES: hypothetical protein [unclassified Microbacterium]|uniref:hypothetical protein n=1 Tax=unclassified Microbacterium TaxID=2609290 RepID=UPI00365A4ABB